MSCQLCGCDPEADHLCEKHTNQLRASALAARTSTAMPAVLPTGAKERKQVPIASGVLDYFPLAIAEIARVSWEGNNQHNPGEPLHWARDKSTDHDDCIIRHFMERGEIDSDGQRHSAKMAWRSLALLQLELEGKQ